MKFSKKNDENEIVKKHKEKLKKTGYKKYIFSIDERCSELLDSMPLEERNDFVNSVICEYNDTTLDRKKIRNLAINICKTIIAILILLFAAPLFLWLINQSFTMTQNSYSDMQKNFEVLYHNDTKSF